tara:strand:- start:21 stop:461 length:441 start_codon:yes stop_codon:yes gene_type:complete
VNTPVTVPVPAVAPTEAATVALAGIPPAITNAPSAPLIDPFVTEATSLKKPSTSAVVPMSTVDEAPDDATTTEKEIGIAPFGRMNVAPVVADVPILTGVKEAAVAAALNEITSDNTTTPGVVTDLSCPPYDLTIPWNDVVAIVLFS